MTNYILEYYQAIKEGEITVGNEIRNWYALIIKGLEKKQYTYAPKRAQAAIVFIENFCRHHEGVLAPQKIKLELWEKALISVIFGIVDGSGNRQFREVFIVIARKNGKTLLAAAIAAYCSFMDGEYGARVYFAAPKLEQASLCFDAYCQMIYKEPMLDKMAKKRRTDVYIQETNSSAKPLAFNAKKSDGLNVSLCVADEVASWTGDAGLKFYEVIKSSTGARKQPMILAITTAGYVNDGIYDELMMRATAVIKGSSSETRFAPFIYKIDDVDKWNSINELQKSNPNLNVSVTIDYLLEEIAIAENSLSKRAEFLTKYCNIKQNSSLAWLDYKTVEKASCKADLSEFRDMYAVGGIDLSQTTDLTAASIVIEKDGTLYTFCQFFLPESKIETAQAADGVPYQTFIKKGNLTISGENYVDYKDVYEWFMDLKDKYGIYILKIGYDRYSAQYLVDDLTAAGWQLDDVWQGENLAPVIREFEGTIKDGKFKICNNNLLKSHFLNVALKHNLETRKFRPVKIDQRKHIDGFVSVIDALTVRQKYYAEIGEMLNNAR